MKKITLVILSLLFLISSTELHELIRLPFLVAHYKQHRVHDRDLSFIDFLKLHYSGDHPADQDDNDDNELPFKSKDSFTHIDTPVPLRRVAEEKQYSSYVNKPVIYFAEDLPAARLFSIFHPPRFA